MTKYPPLGTVSEGTMRSEDLIPAFLDVLQEYDGETYDAIMAEFPLLSDGIDADDWDSADPEELGELTDRLFDLLGELAPPYAYFGASVGDGSDYGYWPSLDVLEDDARFGDVLKVSDTSEVTPATVGPDTQYVMHVNDHGNVTLYAVERAITLREVWSVV